MGETVGLMPGVVDQLDFCSGGSGGGGGGGIARFRLCICTSGASTWSSARCKTSDERFKLGAASSTLPLCGAMLGWVRKPMLDSMCLIANAIAIAIGGGGCTCVCGKFGFCFLYVVHSTTVTLSCASCLKTTRPNLASLKSAAV